jgi:hypothetical protein
MDAFQLIRRSYHIYHLAADMVTRMDHGWTARAGSLPPILCYVETRCPRGCVRRPQTKLGECMLRAGHVPRGCDFSIPCTPIQRGREANDKLI